MAKSKELRKMKIHPQNHGQLQMEADSQTVDHMQPSSSNPSQSYVDQPTNSIGKTISELQEEETEQSDQRRVRGPTLLTEIWNLSEDERVVVDFNKRWQAIGNEGRVLASFLGIVARNANLTPLHIPDWRAFPMKEKRNILKLVKVVAAMCSKVPFLSNAIMKAAQCGKVEQKYLIDFFLWLRLQLVC